MLKKNKKSILVIILLLSGWGVNNFLFSAYIGLRRNNKYNINDMENAFFSKCNTRGGIRGSFFYDPVLTGKFFLKYGDNEEDIESNVIKKIVKKYPEIFFLNKKLENNIKNVKDEKLKKKYLKKINRARNDFFLNILYFEIRKIYFYIGNLLYKSFSNDQKIQFDKELIMSKNLKVSDIVASTMKLKENILNELSNLNN